MTLGAQAGKWESCIARLSDIHGNALTLLLGRTVFIASYFATYAIMGRALGPAGFGPVALATALSSYFVAVVQAGFETYGARDVAQDRSRVHDIVSRIVSARIPVAMACLAFYAIVAWTPAMRSPTALLTFVIFSFTITTGIVNLNFAYQGMERMKYLAAREGGTGLLSLLGAALFIHNPHDTIPAALVLVGAQMINWGLLFAGFSRAYGLPRLDPAPRRLWATYSHVYPIALSSLLIVLYAGIDTSILGYFASPRIVGLYGAASRLRILVNTTAVILMSAFLPALARSAGQRDQMQQHGSAYARLMFFVASPVAIFAAVFSRDVIGFAFGPQFTPIAPILSVLMVVVLGACVNMTTGNPLLVWKKEHAYLRIVMAAAAFNIAGNLLAIPWWGPAGAAAIDAVTETLLFVCFLQVYRKLGLKFETFALAACATCALAAAAASYGLMSLLLPAAPALARLIAGGLVSFPLYLLATWRLRIVDLRRLF